MTDRRVVVIVVTALALMSILGLGGVVWLVSRRVEVVAIAVVASLAGQALGGLTGILASTRTAEGSSAIPPPPPPPPPPADLPHPQKSRSLNEPKDAVPVEETQP